MSGVAVRPAGDRAVLMELADNAAALRVAERLRAERPELVDVVPGHRTVLVTWDAGDVPLGLLELAEAALAVQLPGASQPAHAIDVSYDGPDLEEVARLCALSVEEVVARHSAATYVVGFLGFAPGFVYLLGGDPVLHVPRRDDPRTRVPAGSVAVAGPYSGIYPRASPGGWRLLGRTSAVLFDAAREPPALLAAGDRVRFVAR
jgi:KipI family sensor histidine kinase inhibitor